MSEESEVEVLQDPLTYTRAIYKDPGARWVVGLTPVEVLRATRFPHRDDAAMDGTRFPKLENRWYEGRFEAWMRVPVLLGLLCLVEPVSRIAKGITRHPLDFPYVEESLWDYARRPNDGVADFLMRAWCLWVTSSLTALFTLTLSWKFGTAARNFWTLCGVGLSLLSFMATIAQLFMLLVACGESAGSKMEECDVPFVLYWTFSVIRLGGPLFAVWCVGPVLDIIQDSRTRWKIILGFPSLFLTLSVLLWMVGESAVVGGNNVYQWCGYVTVASWGVLLLRCCGQRRFQVVFVTKPHEE
ncbi:hypothetical protein TraAM80_07170 [Trypanosoma rangeli]|uniref:Transmembrane protein n=1 Tax=Trypanosoma rangeli TaxID=5698 RepID=A0A3R7KTP8_TRYRA|nr:uncharacterized protein TraAM80_07170 [Trypanosoma rangeli]RNF01171.1 hypothetical protein TraAM80_07170 [Trypanosoma rangeli]|eukprot:RNF01171.1 hypothetical protein TraAM80_07170 [Trypanosoma rangeli]